MNLEYAKERDIDIMQHVCTMYKDKDISREVVKNMYLVDLENEFDYVKEENYLKAIHQDLNKIFVAMDDIEIISKERVGCDYINETIGILIEYILNKYRAILDYIYKIADCMLDVPYSKSNLRDYEKYNELLDFLKDNIPFDDNRRNILNTEWFSDIRKTRNSITHNGSTCFVFYNIEETLFQIYDLDVNELVIDGDTYLHEGNCIYYEYYITLNLSYMLYFIDTVFSLIVNQGKINEERKELTEKLEKMAIYIGKRPQETYVDILNKIVNSYRNGNYVISG